MEGSASPDIYDKGSWSVIEFLSFCIYIMNVAGCMNIVHSIP